MKNIFVFILIIIATSLLAQKHDYNWIFGYDYNLDVEGREGSLLNFNEHPLEITGHQREMEIRHINASISDAEGNLLFYTNGCFIADANHERMPNGNELNPGRVYDSQCLEDESGAYTAGQHSAVVIPLPNHPNLYYLIHNHLIYDFDHPDVVVVDAIYYTVIDMDLNEGKGSVIIKNEPLLEDTLNYGSMALTKHANGEDWWILMNRHRSNKYYKILLTAEGFSEAITQEIGLETTPMGASEVDFTSNGKKMVRYDTNEGLYLYDFDRESGLLSNFQHIEVDDGAFWGGVAVSPNSRFVYALSESWVYQFDLEAEDIAASRVTVAEVDGFADPFPMTFSKGQLGPDCRIYFNTTSSATRFHIINQPDEKGLACEVQQHELALPYPYSGTMPYFPNYRLGPLGDEVPPCDWVSPVAEVKETSPQVALVVYPNPVLSEVSVEFKLPARSEGAWSLWDARGQQVLSWTFDTATEQKDFSVAHLSKGMYFYRLEVDGVLLKNGKLVKQ